MNETLRAVMSVLIVALVTLATRALPFLLFSGQRRPPAFVQYLGRLLPYAIMAVLVIYCLKDLQFSTLSGFVPALISAAVVAALHVWKRNNLLSIGAGTLLYMLLIQFVFV